MGKTIVLSDADVARFNSHIAKADGDACWPWTAGKDADGYGQIKVGRKTHKTHRVAWTLANGQIPDGMCVLHRCDNRPCCNPNHHFLGTSEENTADKVAKRRQARGAAISARQVKLVRGEAHHSARLTADAVRLIREECEQIGNLRDIAARYGVSVPAIRKIKNRQSWSHVA